MIYSQNISISHRMHGRKYNAKALEVKTFHPPAPAMSWIVAHQGYAQTARVLTFG